MNLRTIAAVAALTGFAGLALAADKPAAKTASEYYIQYREGLAKAKTKEDLLPYVPEEGRAEMMKASDKEFQEGLKMIQAFMGGITNVKVVKETPAGKDAFTLDVTGTDESNTAGTGTVEVTKVAAGWKKGKETWKFGSSTQTFN
jgi:hypothetical protein